MAWVDGPSMNSTSPSASDAQTNPKRRTGRRSGLIAFGAFASLGTMLVTGNVGGQSIPVGFAPTFTGSITVTKVVTGDGPIPTSWDVTLTSTTPNCAPGLDTVNSSTTIYNLTHSTIPGTGGTIVFSGLPNGYNYNAPCVYELVETPVDGWTPTFSPAGPYTPGTGNINVTLTNSSPVSTTTSTTTTTTVPESIVPIKLTPTTTAAPAASTTTAPVTTTPVTTAATPVTFASTLPTAPPAIEVLATNPANDKTRNGSVKGAGLENEGDQALAYTGKNDTRIAGFGILFCTAGALLSLLSVRKRREN